MKVLILGGKGFIGRHAAKCFAECGWDVYALGNGSWADFSKWGVSRWNDADISKDSLASLSEEIDCVINCSGSGSVALSFESPVKDFEKNTVVTSTVLEYIRSRQPQASLVCLSSAAVYGQSDQMPLSENVSLNPNSPYGFNKKISEDLCRSYATCFGVRSTQLRLFSVYGPGLEKQLLWDAFKKLKQGHSTFFGTGLETRDWIYIDDVTSLLLKVASEAPGKGESRILNGGTGIKTSNKDILSRLSQSLGLNKEIVFSGNARVGDPEHYQADIGRALALGWRPKVSVEEGISNYAKWALEKFSG